MGDNLSTSHQSNPVDSDATLSPLYPVLRRGLTAVTTLGFLSFLTSFGLFLHLLYGIATWKRAHRRHGHSNKASHANQFIILIFNLILADIQQSIAFALNIRWLVTNSITTGTCTCWAQGWFVSTGDLASGVFTFAIALHSLLDIVFNIRLSHLQFMLSILGLWTFIYALAIIGISIHPHDFYTRAGAWCWINAKYIHSRLWLHYLYLIIVEFGTFIIYTAIFLILRHRIKTSYYTSTSTPHLQLRAQSAARMIVAYPIVYVVCTLPLVIARLKTMAGLKVSLLEFCIAGVMITSNGWLDVVLYCLTRRALIFGSEVGDESVRALDTFNWSPSGGAFGNRTTIEAVHVRKNLRKSESLDGLVSEIGQGLQRSRGVREIMAGVKTETTVEVNEEVVELAVLERMKRLHNRRSVSENDLTIRRKGSGVESWDSDLYGSLQFITEKRESVQGLEAGPDGDDEIRAVVDGEAGRRGSREGKEERDET